MSPAARRSLRLGDDIQYLPGVGPKRAVHLRALGIRTIGDLLEYYPFRHERHESRTIENLEEGITAAVVGELGSVRTQFGRRGPTVSATLFDNTGQCNLSWFNAPWIKDRLQRGAVVRATGKVTEYRQRAQLINPTIETLGEHAEPIDESAMSQFEGIYPASAAISAKAIAKLVSNNLDAMLAEVVECHAPEHIRKRELAPLDWSIAEMHRPTVNANLEKARRRLAYDELLLLQLATSLSRILRREHFNAQPLICSEEIDRRIRRRFPFTLTPGQDRAVTAVSANLAESQPMNRMLQGDVGCGKTVVAIHAALTAIANRCQAVIMAPTELLAEQHVASIEKYLSDSRVRYGLLRGAMPARDRRALLEGIAAGKVDLVVGTHALIQSDVEFARLGLVIIDEQHRFGVRQRATIRSKGLSPHYLVMTATPIPRTLAMTVFGDLDVTTIDGLPPGRSPIHTEIITPEKAASAWRHVRDCVARGEQAYVVYPLIDESDKVELRAATTEVERLRQQEFAEFNVGLLHGRLTTAERDEVMADFVANRVNILVATTVVEVGIDVPNATCMVIEHAERYGLAQLHQLRGRIGRGAARGYCFLMTGAENGAENERLNVLAGTTDGFKIAEADLKLRGPGEMLGTRQHGMPALRVADLMRDVELLRLAQQDADDILRIDRQLRDPGRQRLRAALLARYGKTLGFLDVG